MKETRKDDGRRPSVARFRGRDCDFSSAGKGYASKRNERLPVLRRASSDRRRAVSALPLGIIAFQVCKIEAVRPPFLARAWLTGGLCLAGI